MTQHTIPMAARARHTQSRYLLACTPIARVVLHRPCKCLQVILEVPLPKFPLLLPIIRQQHRCFGQCPCTNPCFRRRSPSVPR
jgi:hypothetical protein